MQLFIFIFDCTFFCFGCALIYFKIIVYILTACFPKKFEEHVGKFSWGTTSCEISNGPSDQHTEGQDKYIQKLEIICHK